ncbi:DUF3488 and transglutaminase-like domain-containing protein [Demequina sp. NBRC 110055]|uniref:transglutaminase family protein n=1 Tax=Demequina sp. NBRC 110055 TaxID=1570344 RepID=UPI001356388A|nr:DUF3488 and transglutaminase-like domain-containing protein [Demequina sp. NBRC 110055]
MSAPARAKAPWPASLTVAAATMASLFALTSMVVTGAWILTVAASLAALTATVVVARVVTRSRWWPTVVGLAVTVEALVLQFSVSEEGDGHLLPTPGALRDLLTVMGDGVNYAATTVAPAEMTPALLSLVCAGVMGLFLVAEHIAVSWRAAASAGLVLMLPWLPAAIFQQRVSVAWLLVALAAWLLTLALARRGDATQPPSTLGGAVAATAATLGVSLLVVPSALGGHGWGIIPRIDAPSSLSSTTRLNLDLDLRTSLTTNSTAPALVYTADGRRPDVLRLYSYSEFDGVAWAYGAPSDDEITSTEGLLWPLDIDVTDATTATYEIEAVDSAENNLALPSAPRSVDVEGDWGYSPGTDEVVSPSDSTLGLSYTVTAATDFLSAERLLAAPSDPASDAGVGARYLNLPAAMNAARVSDLAADVTSGATSRFAQAVAMQDYLRDPAEFDYDTSVSPSGGDAVSTFLDDRVGYCVQFATTMVMMARTLDIPARMAIGFLPGSEGEGDTYVVQGGDAHAWPELWFPEVGWVRFEPTPAVQTGSAPVYAEEPDEPAVSETSDPAQQPTTAPQQQPERPDTPDVPNLSGGEAEQSGLDWWWFAIAAAILLAGSTFAVVMMRRRRTDAPAPLDPAERAWLRARDGLPEHARWSLAHTPDEAVEHVRATLSESGRGLSPAGDAALVNLAQAVADHRYAPEGTAHSDAQMREWSAALTTEAGRDAAAEQPTRR